MANKFVWSGATGLNDGSRWEDAYTSLMRNWAAEAGFTAGTDFVFVRDIHDESSGTTLSLLGNPAEGNPDTVRVLTVVGAATGTDPGNLSTGALVNTTAVTADIDIRGKLYLYGVRFFSNNDLLFNNATDHKIVIEAGRLELTGTDAADLIIFGASSVGAHYIFLDTDLDFGAAAQGIGLASGSAFLWDGGILGRDLTTLFEQNVGMSRAVMRNVDLSILTGRLVDAGANDASTLISIERCLLGSGFTLEGASVIDVPGTILQAHHCQVGIDGDPAFQMRRLTYEGSTDLDVARFRNGGATDGERTNAYSWDMDTNDGSNVIELYESLESPPISGWTDGDAVTAHTYRIYVASGATLQDDEIWVDLHGPNDGATNSRGVRKTARLAPRGTPANIATDSTSTWTGTDVGTKQQIDITYTPDKPGPITAYVHLAKPAERVSIDPKIYIDP